MPSWTALYVLLFWPLLLVSCGAAWRWGGSAERNIATLYVAAAITEMALRSRHGFAHIEVGVAAVDLWLLAALLFIVVRYGLTWVYAAAAIQTLAATGHLAKLLVPSISRMAYIMMTGGGGYPQLLLLISGTVGHFLARRDRAAKPRHRQRPASRQS